MCLRILTHFLNPVFQIQQRTFAKAATSIFNDADHPQWWHYIYMEVNK